MSASAFLYKTDIAMISVYIWQCHKHDLTLLFLHWKIEDEKHLRECNDYVHRPELVNSLSMGMCPGFCLRCFDAVGWAAGRASGL